jgi:predicted DNA-binding transcriptional regulator YafY
MTLMVTDTHEFLSWILGWGEKLEVLDPLEIREEVLATVKAVAKLYHK